MAKFIELHGVVEYPFTEDCKPKPIDIIVNCGIIDHINYHEDTGCCFVKFNKGGSVICGDTYEKLKEKLL